jgi:uncharacterized protein YjiS (DUF1127 family)
MTLYERDDFVERLRYRATVWRYLKLVVSGWWADRRTQTRRRRAAIELSEMEDWQLRDIGLDRSEVEKLLGQHGIARDRERAAKSINAGHFQ